MGEHFILIGLFNVILGALLGAIGGVLGIGGGVIAIPALVYLYGMNQHLAQGTALVMIAPNVLLGFIRYRQRNDIDLRSCAVLGGLAIVTTYVAARYATSIDAKQLQTAFAIFLFLLVVYFIWQIRFKETASKSQAIIDSKFLPAVSVVSGIMSGVFTIGGGLIAVPAFVTLFGKTQTQAQGMGLALVIPGAIVALLAYAQAGHVDWSVGIPLAIGGIMSVSWGVALAHKFSPQRLRIMFCAVLLGTAMSMLMH